MASASGSAVMPSFDAMVVNSPTRSDALMRRKSNRWHRESTVIGTLRISVVAKMNFTCSGGSSSVFNSPLKACVESM